MLDNSASTRLFLFAGGLVFFLILEIAAPYRQYLKEEKLNFHHLLVMPFIR